MLRCQVVPYHDVGAGCAHIACRATFVIAKATQELRFDGNWKVLVECHRGRVLGMQHHPTIALSPSRTIRNLVSDKAVLDQQFVATKGQPKKNMTELISKTCIVVIADLQKSVFDSEGLILVLTNRLTSDLPRPGIKVLAVKKLLPCCSGSIGIGKGDGRRCNSTTNAQECS